MGKKLKHQIRGKATPRYVAPSHRYKADVTYRPYDDVEKTSALKGEILDFVDDPGRNTILAKVLLENKNVMYIIAPEGMAVGDEIEIGAQAQPTLGSILPLYAIPDGTYIYNIEKNPGDGGKFVRAAGTSAILVSKDDKYAYIKMPSKKVILFNLDCRAEIGVVAGGGFKEKPLLKAGNAYYKWKARNKLWPKNRGVKMSAYDHPFGGKEHHQGKSTTVKRSAPPGRKVGHISARQTGRRSKKSNKR